MILEGKAIYFTLLTLGRVRYEAKDKDVTLAV
jgi:hypothetical protein